MTVVLRVGLSILALVMIVVGGWNQFWPEHFFAVFPGVSDLPPYSEHFARDFGGAALGIGVVLACAAVVTRTVLVVPALLGVSAWTLPHAWFHLTHLHGSSPEIVAFNVIATGSAAVAPVLLLAFALLGAARDRARRAERAGTIAREPSD
jgi:hypothetical protein